MCTLKYHFFFLPHLIYHQQTFNQGKGYLYNEQKNSLRLRFKYNFEYINVGQKIVINDELVKAVGIIKEIYY